MHVSELVKKYYEQKPAAVKGIKRLTIELNINMSQSTSPFMSGYTWDQVCLATVEPDDHQKRAALEAEAYFFDPTKEHRRPGQPNSITYKQV